MGLTQTIFISQLSLLPRKCSSSRLSLLAPPVCSLRGIRRPMLLSFGQSSISLLEYGYGESIFETMKRTHLTLAMVMLVDVLNQTDSRCSRLFSAMMANQAESLRLSRLPSRWIILILGHPDNNQDSLPSVQ